MARILATALATFAMSLSTPSLAAVSITDSIDNPAGRWAGIDYWGVQVGRVPSFDQTLTFDLPEYSTVGLFVGGSPKFQFTDILLNGTSIASNITLANSTTYIGAGYADAGRVSLQFKGTYDCPQCWGDWFGGYVQVNAATPPNTAPVSGPIPEPATWAMMIGGLAFVGWMMRRRTVRASFS